MSAQVEITSAAVVSAEGLSAATIDLVTLGGGSQVVTVDGVPEQRLHPTRRVFHVRLLSPDRMVADELREVDTYDEAVALGLRYADKLSEHADRLASLAEDLRV